MKETISDTQLIGYIDKLVASFGLYQNVNETALRIQFDHNLYPECVREIMQKMGIINSVKLRKYSKQKWPHKNAAAVIELPQTFPTFASAEFKKMLLLVEICETTTEDFYAFVSSIAHELSHIVLHGTKHELHKSEIATDLCAMVFGFSEYYLKGRTTVVPDILWGKVVHKKGYLDDHQCTLSYEYIQGLQRERFGKQKTQPNKSFWEILQNLFK